MNGYGQQVQQPQMSLTDALRAQEVLARRENAQQQMMQSGNPYALLGSALGGMVSRNFGKYKDTSLNEVQNQLNQYQAEQEAKLKAIADAEQAKKDQAMYERKKADEIEKENRNNQFEMRKLGATQEGNMAVAKYRTDNAKGQQIINNMPATGEIENEFQKKLASGNAAKFNEWETQAMGANETLSNIQKLKEITQLQKTGKGQEAMAVIGQWVGNEAGSNMQSFQAIQKKMMLDGAASLKGAMSDGEWSVLQAQMPDFGNDPRANEAIMGVLESAAQRSIANYQGANEYVQKNGKLQGYTPKFQFAGSREQKAPQQNQDFSKMSNAELMAAYKARQGQ